MKNLLNLTKDDNEGSKVAFLFVFFTVLIGSSAFLPTEIFQDTDSGRGVDSSTSSAYVVDINKQTGRYLKMPSRF